MSLFKNKKEPTPIILEPKPRPLKDLLSALLTLVLMVAFVLFFLNYVGQRVQVDGSSMETTLQNEDQLIVDCFSYHFLRDPKRFEVVVFRLKDEPETYYVKRIIGLPGESVQIINSTIYINGVAIDDPYCPSDGFTPGVAAELIRLGGDEYFVMGDNRNNSTDSRSSRLGPIKKEQMVGRAIYRILPLDKRGSLVPEVEP